MIDFYSFQIQIIVSSKINHASKGCGLHTCSLTDQTLSYAYHRCFRIPDGHVESSVAKTPSVNLWKGLKRNGKRETARGLEFQTVEHDIYHISIFSARGSSAILWFSQQILLLGSPRQGPLLSRPLDF